MQSKITFHPEAGITMPDIGSIQPGKITFSETEVVDGIQQVSFTYPVLATNTDDPFSEVKRPVTVVLELK